MLLWLISLLGVITAQRLGRAGIMTPYDVTPGGGEQYLLTAALSMQENYIVDLLVFNTNYCSNISCVANTVKLLGLPLNMERLNVRVVEYARWPKLKDISRYEYDVFFLLGNEAYPQTHAVGKYSFYMCQFPFDFGAIRSKHLFASYLSYDHVILNSEYSLSQYLLFTSKFRTGITQMGFVAPKMSVLYPPVDVTDTSSVKKVSQRTNDVVVLGRFFFGRQSKGHEVAIFAFRQLLMQLGENANVKLHLIGAVHRGQSWYVEYLRSISVDIPVFFYENAPRHILLQILSSSLTLWHLSGMDKGGLDPASNEHFGIAIVEAISLGCIPIVSALGGPAEIVMFEPTLLSPTPTDYIKNYQSLVALPESNREALRSKLIERSKEFTRENFHKSFGVSQYRYWMSWHLYKYVIQKTGPALARRKCEVAGPSAQMKAVIIEPRFDPIVGYVVKNVIRFLGPSWGVIVLHGSKNKEFIQSELSACSGIEYMSLERPNVDIPYLNRIMKTTKFWTDFKAENILIFQSDAILRRSGIDEFLKYDYIGAPWHLQNKIVIKTHGLLRVGNGGLSLRTASSMIEAIERFGNTTNDKEDEDVFFARALHVMGRNVASPQTAANFAMEVPNNDLDMTNPLSLHSIYKYVESAQLLRLMASLQNY